MRLVILGIIVGMAVLFVGVLMMNSVTSPESQDGEIISAPHEPVIYDQGRTLALVGLIIMGISVAVAAVVS